MAYGDRVVATLGGGQTLATSSLVCVERVGLVRFGIWVSGKHGRGKLCVCVSVGGGWYDVLQRSGPLDSLDLGLF